MTPGNRGVGKARIGGTVSVLVWAKWGGADLKSRFSSASILYLITDVVSRISKTIRIVRIWGHVHETSAAPISAMSITSS